MNRSQKYLSTLLERLPKYELRSYEHQTYLDQIRDRISSTVDVQAELRNLYQVKGFADFVLSLMWIADKVEKDPTMDESTLDEETLVFSKFREAVGDTSGVQQEPAPSSTVIDLPIVPGFEQTTMEAPEPSIDPRWGSVPRPPSPTPRTSDRATIGREQERTFARLLEQFLESVQSGNEDRISLMSEVIKECNAVITDGTGAEEYKQFCKLLVEFLNYISDNQFLDDVRVMNIVSNIQDPFSQWARSETENRSGLLDQAIDILRDFKTMFE